MLKRNKIQTRTHSYMHHSMHDVTHTPCQIETMITEFGGKSMAKFDYQHAFNHTFMCFFTVFRLFSHWHIHRRIDEYEFVSFLLISFFFVDVRACVCVRLFFSSSNYVFSEHFLEYCHSAHSTYSALVGFCHGAKWSVVRLYDWLADFAS